MTAALCLLSAAVMGATAPDAPKTLRLDWTIDGVVAGSAITLWLASDSLKFALAPSACLWCDRGVDGANTLNGLDAWGRGARWSLSAEATADTLSSVAAFGVLTPVILGADAWLSARSGSLATFPGDALIVSETVALAMTANQATKFIAGRERPFVHVLPQAQKALTQYPADNNLSFFSGHTTYAFALVAAMGTVAEMRGYQDRWIIWAVGIPLAATVPYLRMAADRHYFTDVIAGAIIGSAFGVAVPLLFHTDSRNAPIRVYLQPSSVTLDARW